MTPRQSSRWQQYTAQFGPHLGQAVYAYMQAAGAWGGGPWDEEHAREKHDPLLPPPPQTSLPRATRAEKAGAINVTFEEVR